MRHEVLALCLLAAPVSGAPSFEPVDVPHHVYQGGWEHFVGGGIAAFDCDDDDLPELYAAGGSADAILLRNRSTPDGPILFMAETPEPLRLTGVIGAYPLDLDSDGWLDLAVLRVGPNLLMQGGPGCHFAPFEGLGFQTGDRWTTAFSATWEVGQSLPTLAFGNYVDRGNPEGPFRACDQNLLYRPQGETYTDPVSLDPGFCPLSMLFGDWSRSGRADLRISNDRHYYIDAGQEQLWAMTDPPRLYDTEDGWQTHRLWGMGIASRDLDGDGRAEVFLTSMGDQRLQRLTDATAPTYQDVPFEIGTTAHRPHVGGDGRPSTGWHVAFGDVQNDGRDDIFIAKGNVEQMPDSAMDDPNSLLIQKPDGTFAEQGGPAGVASFHRGRGAALVDLNADGLLDLAVVNRRASLEIWQNVTAPAGQWLSVALHQPGPNARAVGAFVEVETTLGRYVQEVTVGGGHAGGSAVPLHFGLGSVDQVQLRVIWPDGETTAWTGVTPDQRLRLSRIPGSVELDAY